MDQLNYDKTIVAMDQLNYDKTIVAKNQLTYEMTIVAKGSTEIWHYNRSIVLSYWSL